MRKGFLVYFDIEPSRPVGDNAEYLQTLLMRRIPHYRPVVYVATSDLQPDETSRKGFELYVNLDPLPGVFHSTESAHHELRKMLSEDMPGRNGLISVAPDSLQPKES